MKPSPFLPLRYRALWLLVGWAMVLTVVYLSLERGEKLPDVPGGDKIHHFIAYGSMMAWFAQLYPHRRIVVAVGLILLGVAIEFLQPVLSNRYFEAMDMVANSVGVGLGWLAMRSPLRASIAWADGFIQKTLHR